MKGITHPFTKAVYEQEGGEGRVRVTQTDGRSGVYSVDGRWLSGDKIDIDFHLVGWVGGPKVMHHRLQTDEEA